jgi:type I restriction enzyme S subunit
MELESCRAAPADWKRVSIAEVCSKFTSGGTPSRKRPEYFESGILPWVKTKELLDAVLHDAEEWITEEAVTASSAKRLPRNTVLMAMYGATVGQLGVLGREMACNQACAAMIVDEDRCDFRYLYYQLLANRKQIVSMATGAAQQNLSGLQIKSWVIPLAPRTEQERIAGLLWELDQRIALLRQTNSTLEAIAQALFKSWFVDFDPVRAKAEGREPDGVGAAAAALFPSEFEESELGPIPKGWRVGGSNELLEIVGGGTPKTSVDEFWGGDIPWFSVVDAPASGQVFTLDTTKKITEAGLANCSAKLLPPLTTIISARGTVGKVAMTGVPMAMNQSCYALRPKVAGGEAFIYFSTLRFVERLQRIAHGAVFDTITRDSFKQVVTCLPSDGAVAAFNSFAEPLLQRIRANGFQAASLAGLRDALLPRLISGKLRLPEAAALAEDALA